MLQTIVVGCDLSAPSDDALARAIGVARLQDEPAKLVLVHAHGSATDVGLGELAASGGPGALDVVGQVSAAVRRAERDKLEALRAQVEARGLTAEIVLRAGEPPAEVLAETAVGKRADLLVVGHHGATAIQRMLLGSVASETVRRAPCDVLVCRGPGVELGFGKPIVAMDFSAAASRALAHVVPLTAPETVIEVVHAWQLPAGSWGTAFLGLQSKFPWSTVRDAMLDSAKEQAERLRTKHVGLGRPFHIELVQGPPASTVTGVAERGGYDLIVVGTNGHRGFRRLLLGSVADGVIRHAPCSVLVVHGEHAGQTAMFPKFGP